jgi:hypothetical protein
MANIQTPDIVQSYVAGDENALATLIKDMNPYLRIYSKNFR